MKMGNRKLKRLDRLGVQIQNKTRVSAEPVNRAEKRRLKHLIRRTGERLPPEDEAILFATGHLPEDF